MKKYKKVHFDYDHWYDDKMDDWFEAFCEFSDSDDMVHVDYVHDVLMELLLEIGTEIKDEIDDGQ